MGRWYKVIVALAALLGMAGALAQGAAIVGPGDEEPTRRPPQIWIDPALGKLEPITLAEMHVDVRMTGFLASTTVELRFHNPNNRVLEGELVFPLASSQTITGYALEVDGTLREGVVVPKETARVAFEEITRRGIDPGLAELTRGNVFRTRVYPIPAQGDKRVRFSFDQQLIDAGDHWRYVLPLHMTQKIGRFSVHAEAVHSERAPAAEGYPGTFGFKKVRDSFVADLEQTDVQPQRELAFSVPKVDTTTVAYAVADVLEPAWRTVAAQIDTGLPADLRKSPPRHIALFYDASGSAAARDRARESALLAAWLKQLSEVQVELVPFRDAADTVQSFDVTGGDSTALLKAIDALPLDGGSSYGAIDIGLVKHADTVLVIGDGLSNFAGDQPSLSRVDGRPPRLLLLHSAQSVDQRALTAMARRHGGVLLNLLELSAEQALARIGQPQWQLLGATADHGECVDLAPLAPTPVNRYVGVYARCKGDAVLTLEFGDGSSPSLTRVIKLADAAQLEPAAGRQIQRLWATARIADLDAQNGADDPAITALATRYGVVTANTSMLVLDRIEDYVHYRVKPVEPELLAQYEAMLGSQPKIAVAAPPPVDRSHLDGVLAQWRALRDWHAQRHPWLETVLQPAASAELARWQALQADPRLKPLAKSQLATLAQLAQQSADLQQRWLKDGANDTSRAGWEREAARVMLAVDAARMARLKAWPDSDAAAVQPEPAIVTEAGAAPVESMALADSAVAAEPMAESVAAPSPPPPPRPALALRAVAAPGGAAGPDADLKQEIAANGDAASPSSIQAKPQIQLADWNPDTPYLAKLRAARDPYAAYLRERELQGSTPAFYLDCADFFRLQVKDQKLALRILSNLAELDIESAPLVRVLAYRLSHWERFDLAIPLFETALKLRGEEPQSRRDLALALSRAPQPDYPRAIALLWEVVSRPWDGRFPDIGVIALHELNDVLARMPADASAALDLPAMGIEPAFIEPLPVDLRVVLSWDADNTDIDLWVIDPTGEIAIYNHPQTATGGQVSRDFTGGYGPEVFTIRRALPGTYVVKAHYYGDRVQKLTGAVTVQVEFLTNFSRPDSSRQAITRRLEGDEDTLEVGRFVAPYE